MVQLDGWQPIDSTMLSAVAYENGTLHAKYKNGKVYSHPGVPKEKFQALLGSASKGKYFNDNIKTQHPAAQ